MFNNFFDKRGRDKIIYQCIMEQSPYDAKVYENFIASRSVVNNIILAAFEAGIRYAHIVCLRDMNKDD